MLVVASQRRRARDVQRDLTVRKMTTLNSLPLNCSTIWQANHERNNLGKPTSEKHNFDYNFKSRTGHHHRLRPRARALNAHVHHLSLKSVNQKFNFSLRCSECNFISTYFPFPLPSQVLDVGWAVEINCAGVEAVPTGTKKNERTTQVKRASISLPLFLLI